jgi:hypothetical protein
MATSQAEGSAISATAAIAAASVAVGAGVPSDSCSTSFSLESVPVLSLLHAWPPAACTDQGTADVADRAVKGSVSTQKATLAVSGAGFVEESTGGFAAGNVQASNPVSCGWDGNCCSCPFPTADSHLALTNLHQAVPLHPLLPFPSRRSSPCLLHPQAPLPLRFPVAMPAYLLSTLPWLLH